MRHRTPRGNARFREGRSRCSSYLGWGILLAYALFLVCRAYFQGASSATWDTPVWELQHLSRLTEWMSGLALRLSCEFTHFAVLGFLAAVVVSAGSGRLGRLPIRLPAVATAGAVAVLTSAARGAGSARPLATAGLLLPLLGGLCGAWAGTVWRRGGRARLWLMPKVALLVALAVLGLGVVAACALAQTPLAFEPVRVASADKRRLADLTSDKNPASLQKGQTHTLRLTEHDVNVLLSWGLSLGPTDRKALVHLERDSISLRASVLARRVGGRPCYLNLTATGAAAVTEGTLCLQITRCRIGALEVPVWVLHFLGPFLAARLNHDPRARPFLDAAQEVIIEPQTLQLTYGYLNLPVRLRDSLFGPSRTSAELLASVRTQVDCLLLLGLVRQTFDAEPSLALCLQTAFTTARDRSARRDPVRENQAALLALGILVGHPRLEEFVGRVLTDPDQDPALLLLRRAAVQGRPDWARHFCVSAALVLLSNATVSDAAGQLKEELDAEAGGSGFSFADLLADRAGTTFARAATRDEASARRMQERLARDFRIEEIIPPADDLPEGLFDAELQARYGGVDGEGYRRLVEQIDRRIAACTAYR